MKYYSFQKGTFAGVANVIVSATGYTGAGGFEIYVENKDASLVWDAIMSAAENHGIQAAGLGCRDTLRLEMGYCLYGNDIDDSTSPIEAGLGWITKFKKGDFVDKAYLENQKNNGTEKKLVGFIVDDKRPARHGYSIVDENGLTIGTVSSGSSSPSLGYPVGMGYVQMSHAAVGTKIWIDVRGKQVEASVCTLPFLKK
jgi:aminomethyltransferase